MEDWGERAWHGPGFRLPSAPGRLTVDDPEDFTASVRWMRSEHVSVSLLSAGPHRFDATQQEVEAFAGRYLRLAVLGDGEVDAVTLRGARTLRRGDVVLSEGRTVGSFRARTTVRLLSSTVGLQHVPEHLLRPGLLPAVLPRTRLVNSAIAFLSALMAGRPGDQPDGPPDPHLARALIDLQVGVLAEYLTFGQGRPGRTDLRGRIEEFVLEHLGESDLGPARIAEALGISLRYAHQVFNRDGETLAQYVRDRRLESVASALRDPEGPERLSELATRFGFASRDQLTRAFRRRYGMTMGEYREREPVGV